MLYLPRQKGFGCECSVPTQAHMSPIYRVLKRSPALLRMRGARTYYPTGLEARCRTVSTITGHGCRSLQKNFFCGLQLRIHETELLWHVQGRVHIFFYMELALILLDIYKKGTAK